MGTHRYKLAAADSKGRLAKMAFDVYVSPAELGDISHEFSIVLDLDYRQFSYKVIRYSIMKGGPKNQTYVSIDNCGIYRMFELWMLKWVQVFGPLRT